MKERTKELLPWGWRMRVGLGGLAIVLALSLGASAAPRKARPAPAAGALTVTSWATLDDETKRSARAWVGRDSVISVDPNGTEHVTVFGKKRDLREQNWRGDLGATAPTYEASNSGAAQSQYTSYPQWDSDQEMRTMSGIKDFLGLCHFPLTCPGGGQ